MMLFSHWLLLLKNWRFLTNSSEEFIVHLRVSSFTNFKVSCSSNSTSYSKSSIILKLTDSIKKTFIISLIKNGALVVKVGSFKETSFC